VKFKHWYWDNRGCQSLVEIEIGRTANAIGKTFSLTNKQKLALCQSLEGKSVPAIEFDGYDYRNYLGLYGYPKSEVVAVRVVVDGELLVIRKNGSITR